MATTEERLTYLEGQYGHLATKADLASVEGGLKADIAAVDGALKAEIANVRTDIAKMETRLIKWMIGLMVGSAALACSIAIVVLGLFR